MKHALLAIFAGAALIACSPSSDPAAGGSETVAAGEPVPEPNPAPPGIDPTNPPPDACGAAQYADLVGKPITSEGVPPEGPGVRYIRPGTQVTMDFRPDRLNIDIDANDIITGFRCT